MAGPAEDPRCSDPATFAARYRIRFDEAGLDGLARASTLLRLAQDMAWQHGTSLGFSRAWYLDRQLAWLARAVDLDLRAAIPVGAALRAGTRVVGHRRIWARRQVDFWLDEELGPVPGREGDGAALAGPRPAAVALTDWVLVDGSGRPVRIPESFGALFAAPMATFDLTRVGLDPAPGHAWRSGQVVRPQELDPNGHLNSAVHLDWLDEAVAAAGGGAELGAIPRRYRVEYAAPLAPGARVEIAAWRTGVAPGVAWQVEMTRAGDVGAAARSRLDVAEPGG